MSKPSVILVVSPHPDDLEIGMGGTVARFSATGTRVISLVLTDGRRSPRSFSCSDAQMAIIRKAEVEAAAALLGINDLFTLGLADLRSEENQQQAITQFLALIERLHPDEIYLPHPKLDRHDSHRIGAQICLSALKSPYARLWAYEVWGLFSNWDRIEDISDYIERKQAAIECHRSQVSDVDYSAGVLGLNRWRAVFTDPHQIPSYRYVEAFLRLD
ncbi:MAG: PIG-L deacetylase family protein [Acidobacteriota bacterium]